MNLTQIAERLNVSDEEFKNSPPPENSEVYGCIYVLGVNISLGVPIFEALALAGFITSNHHLLKFLGGYRDFIRYGACFDDFFKEEGSSYQGILTDAELTKAFSHGENEGELDSNLINWAEPKLEEDWRFKHLMQGQEWQRSYFKRMKELSLKGFALEESLREYARELQGADEDNESVLYQNVILISKGVTAGQGYIQSLHKAENSHDYPSPISPITLNWNAAGVAAMSMEHVYKHLLP